MKATIEKRQHRRARPLIAATCRFIQHPAAMSDGQPIVAVRLIDISATGMGIAFPGILSIGTRLRIDFATESGRFVSLYGEVVRVAPHGSQVTQLIVHGLRRIDRPSFL